MAAPRLFSTPGPLALSRACWAACCNRAGQTRGQRRERHPDTGRCSCTLRSSVLKLPEALGSCCFERAHHMHAGTHAHGCTHRPCTHTPVCTHMQTCVHMHMHTYVWTHGYVLSPHQLLSHTYITAEGKRACPRQEYPAPQGHRLFHCGSRLLPLTVPPSGF